MMTKLTNIIDAFFYPRKNYLPHKIAFSMRKKEKKKKKIRGLRMSLKLLELVLYWLIMENINIVLNNSIPSFEINCMSPGLSIASSEPKEPTSTYDRHLSHLRKHSVSPQDAESATIVLPFGEDIVESH
ncbi:hypothetical protein TorRG33x02_344870 [Trema orientale]|uniref:Uncharacterized protein n=1 Tax=Trema orientale TaxID=63057 RepID=A0A2P5APY2_TREOI|nr:hypothetical protein TorRG33x02_344870 [Trema orientale]